MCRHLGTADAPALSEHECNASWPTRSSGYSSSRTSPQVYTALAELKAATACLDAETDRLNGCAAGAAMRGRVRPRTCTRAGPWRARGVAGARASSPGAAGEDRRHHRSRVTEFEAVGGITFIGAADPVSAKRELCGERSQGPRPAMATWARHHACDADDARPPRRSASTRRSRAPTRDRLRDPKRDTFWPSLSSHVGEAGSQAATYAERGRRLVRQVRRPWRSSTPPSGAGADIRLGVIEGPTTALVDALMLRPCWAVGGGRGWPTGPRAFRSRSWSLTTARSSSVASAAAGPSGKKLVLDETRQRRDSARTTDVIVDPARRREP